MTRQAILGVHRFCLFLLLPDAGLRENVLGAWEPSLQVSDDPAAIWSDPDATPAVFLEDDTEVRVRSQRRSDVWGRVEALKAIIHRQVIQLAPK
eukprot:6189731-Pleurochrysis_carterae.AAC.5